MRLRHGFVPAAVAVALAVPAQALAQGAGDDQYTDPFGPDSAATPTPTPRPRATAAPAPAQPAAPAATATPRPAGGQSGPAAAPGPTLPYTGVDAWVPGLGGALLLGTGVALRLRLREPH